MVKKANAQTTPSFTNPCASPTLPTNDIFLAYFKTQYNNIQWLAGDVDLDVDMAGRSISLSMNLRMRRDSAIWLNITKWGINVARALVRPDSIFVLNFIQNQAIMLPMSAAKDRLGLDINFATLQNMLLGNPTFLGTAENLMLTPIDSGLHVKNQVDALQIDFELNKKCQILNTTIKRTDEPAQILVTYANYESMNEKTNSQQIFSFYRKLDLKGFPNGDGTIIFEFERPLEINVPKKMRFEIPKDYKKIDKF